MKHPKCRTCGKEHALGGCPEFQTRRSSVVEPAMSKAASGSTPDACARSTASRKDESRVNTTTGDLAEQRGNAVLSADTQALPVDTTSPKFDKKAWQRDYMREFRKGLRRREQK